MFMNIIYILNILIGLGLLFFQRKDVNATICWLLIFAFVPVLGPLFFSIFESGFLLYLLSKQYRGETVKQELSESLTKSYRKAPPRDEILPMVQQAKVPYTADNQVDLLVDGEAKFDRLFADIQNATESINVLYFIFDPNEEVGRTFVDLLCEKAQQGVAVRLLYDRFGRLRVKKKDFDRLVACGGQVEVFLPTLRRSLLFVNYRLHRKLVVIDGKIAYTGGINVADEYLGRNPKRSPWRDTSVRIEGSAVAHLQVQFTADWLFVCEQQKKKNAAAEEAILRSQVRLPETDAGTMGVQVLSCGPDTELPHIRDTYLKLIASAKDYLFIQTPYLIPGDTLLDMLRIADNSGVDVRILIPGIPDKKFVYHATLANANPLLKNGVRVYTHKGFVHAKTLVADDRVVAVGTANFDNRSFRINYELATVVHDAAFAKECRETFLKDLEDATELLPTRGEDMGFFSRMREGFWRLVGPLL